MDDDALKDLIEDELEWEPSIDATNIGVGVEEGVVTLMGRVGSFTEKVRASRTWHDREIAEQAAWSAPGVTNVIDNIGVI